MSAASGYVWLLIFAFTCSSCASIVSRTSYSIRVQSEPSAADVNIYNRKGREVYSGRTPCHVSLKTSAGYFQRAIYTLEFSKPGFARKTVLLSSTINGWYFGNILIGGLIGFLIVDPATGAMYTFQNREVIADLVPASVTGERSVPLLQVVDLSTIPEHLKKNLQQIK